ncbi:uncharacterized protein LOC131593171 [Vicia villosa]|uniref:uncharacterized protein LOC131593171 n=1 Tax=Vicia villosa TaxID=3911 RepID=UPI00273C1E27|nr:uncharacterized protein LOC131593171 [Vicia villosa]
MSTRGNLMLTFFSKTYMACSCHSHTSSCGWKSSYHHRNFLDNPSLGCFPKVKIVHTSFAIPLSVPMRSLAAYGVYVRPMPYSNEIGLRMLIGGVVRKAAVLGYHWGTKVIQSRRGCGVCKIINFSTLQ